MKVIPLKIDKIQEAKKYMQDVGATSYGVGIMAPKAVYYAFKVEGISSFAANIIKQHMLSLGSDAAISRDAILKKIKTSLIIFGNLSQLKRLITKLRNQPFELKKLGTRLEDVLRNYIKNGLVFGARGRVLKTTKPLICGIINLTPDSFAGDGLLSKIPNPQAQIPKLVLRKVEEMVKYGAKFIDMGGESTRPFAKPVSEDEEIRRVMPALREVRKRFTELFISVDTYKYKVAKAAAEEGADVINDITALRKFPQMVSLIKKYKLGCILMHMKGTPKTMQVKPTYRNVIEEIFHFLDKRVTFCLDQGIDKDQLMIDPGIGFGKTLKDNLKILNGLCVFKSLGLPIFLGVSKKSFIGKILNVDVDKRLIGTVAAIVVSLANGANVFRVHDVKEANQALKVANQIIKACQNS